MRAEIGRRRGAVGRVRRACPRGGHRPQGKVRAGKRENLPIADHSVDVATSALVLNFVPDWAKALGEMRRVTRPGGLVSFYVWDYPGGGMGFIERFWKAAAELDPKAADLDEGRRFPFCTEAGLRQLCGECGIANATVAPIEIERSFLPSRISGSHSCSAPGRRRGTARAFRKMRGRDCAKTWCVNWVRARSP